MSRKELQKQLSDLQASRQFIERERAKLLATQQEMREAYEAASRDVAASIEQSEQLIRNIDQQVAATKRTLAGLN